MESEEDPTAEVPPETPFDKLPPTWVCPHCGMEKDCFEHLIDEPAAFD